MQHQKFNLKKSFSPFPFDTTPHCIILFDEQRRRTCRQHTKSMYYKRTIYYTISLLNWCWSLLPTESIVDSCCLFCTTSSRFYLELLGKPTSSFWNSFRHCICEACHDQLSFWCVVKCVVCRMFHCTLKAAKLCFVDVCSQALWKPLKRGLFDVFWTKLKKNFASDRFKDLKYSISVWNMFIQLKGWSYDHYNQHLESPLYRQSQCIQTTCFHKVKHYTPNILNGVGTGVIFTYRRQLLLSSVVY